MASNEHAPGTGGDGDECRALALQAVSLALGCGLDEARRCYDDAATEARRELAVSAAISVPRVPEQFALQALWGCFVAISDAMAYASKRHREIDLADLPELLALIMESTHGLPGEALRMHKLVGEFVQSQRKDSWIALGRMITARASERSILLP